MKVAELIGLGKIVYRDYPRPTPGPGELIIKVQAVGLCSTDVKACFYGHPYLSPPCVLGHEFTGTVTEVGAGVTRFRIGDAVVAAPYVECGQCALCKQGLGELCSHKSFISGALQEYVRLPSRIVEQATLVLPEGVNFVLGTLVEPLACVFNAIERAKVQAGKYVLVIGAGPMGIMLAQVAESFGANVLVSERSQARLQAAERLGIPVIRSTDQDFTDLLDTVWARREADIVFVAVGASAAVEQSLGLVSPGGTLVVFGGMPKGELLRLDAYSIHYREVTVTGSFGYRAAHFRQAAQWLAKYAHRVEGIITDVIPFTDVLGALQRVRDGHGLKTVVRFLPE